MRRPGWIVSIFLIWVVSAQVSHATDPVFSDWKGRAIRGYDPVSYFIDADPVEGEKELSHVWNGASWHFATEENRQAFIQNPKKYAPQFGGYCAWAVSQGYTASTDPLAWDISDGRLYLNYSKSVQQNWLRNKAANIEQGNVNWPELSQ